MITIGIDLGGMSAKGVCLSNGTFSKKATVKTSANKQPIETAEDLAMLCRQVSSEAGVSFDEVDAIGIGSPGVIDSENGKVVLWSNFQWENVPLAEYLSQKTKKRVFVLNDANAAAYGEYKFGAGKRYQSSVLVTLGTGIGSGIILNGELYEGYCGAGAELGHMVIKMDGERCSCGRNGCFERYASTSALIRRTREEMQKRPQSTLWKYAKRIEDADGRTAFLALAEGDVAAANVINDYVAALGEGIVNIVNIFRPEAILIGGGISAEGERLLSPLREYVMSHMYVSYSYAPFDLIKAELGNDAGLYGACQFALERISK